MSSFSGSKYSPCKVQNPRDGHMIILLPNQQLIIDLDEASKWQKDVPALTLFDVTTSSPFLMRAAEKHKEDGSTEIVYEQVYDLTSWCEHGMVYLGEVHVAIQDAVAILCVYCRHSAKNDVVTVINPKNSHVKIEPSQILEIVIHGQDDSIMKQEDYIKSDVIIHGKKSVLWENGTQFLEKLREETIICPETHPHRESIFNVINRDVTSLPVNPTMTPATKEAWEMKCKRIGKVSATTTTVQRHYWLRLNPVECEGLTVEKNQCFLSNPEIADVSITVNSGSNNYVIYRTNLSLCHRGLVKHGLPTAKNPDVVKETGKQQGLVDQYHSSINNLIVNPSYNLMHELSPTDVGVFLELSLPSAMYPTCVDYPNLKWEVTPAPIHSMGMKRVPRLVVVDLPCRYINGKKVQRFWIIRDKLVMSDAPMSDNAFFLGVINIKCNSLSVLGDKILNLWEVKTKGKKLDVTTGLQLKQRKATKPLAKTTTTALAVVPPERRLPAATDRYDEARWRNWPTKTGNFIKVVVKEQFEEMSAGTEVTVFESIVNKVFDEDKGNKRHHHQNHRQGGHEHACAYSPNYGKKKEETSQKNEVRKVRPNQTSPAKKENKVFMLDPKDGDYEVLTYKQELIIQVPVAYWGLEQDLQHLWLPVALSPGQPKLRIKSQRIVVSSIEGTYVQEFVVRLLPSFIKDHRHQIDRHFAGGIRFENAMSYFTVLVYLDVLSPIEEKEIDEMNDQLNWFRELIKLNGAAKADMASLKMYQERAILAKAAASIPQQTKSGGMTICLQEPLGDSVTQVNINDRVKIMLDKRPLKDASLDLYGFPDWLDFTNRHKSEYYDIFEFEANSTKVATAKLTDAVRFLHIQGNTTVYKTVKLQLVSPTMPVGVLG